MVTDLSRLRNRLDIIHAFNMLRRASFIAECDYNVNMKFCKLQHSNVLRYYLDAKFLLARIREISGFTQEELVADSKKSIAKPIVWSILSVYGHTNADICRIFKHGRKTGGLTQYYRNKLKDLMAVNPNCVYIYNSIMTVLEKDKEDFDNELTQ